MNNFLKKTLLFLFPILIVLILLEITTRAIPNTYSYKKKYLDKNSSKIKVLFLGNSHAYYGVNPKLIKTSSFNAAYVSQSLNYDYKILYKYKDCWDSLQYVFIPIDYFALYNRLEYGSESYRTKNYVNYFQFPTNDLFINNLELLNGSVSQKFSRFFRVFSKRKKSGFNDISCNELGWGGWTKTNVDLNVSGKLAALRQKLNSNGFININTQELKNIILFLKEREIKLVLYTLPACKGYIESFDSNQFEIIRNIGLNLTKKNSNVKYFDFLSDPSFSEIDFHDGDHLSIEGARKFSLKIDSVLRVLPSLTK